MYMYAMTKISQKLQKQYKYGVITNQLLYNKDLFVKLTPDSQELRLARKHDYS